MSGMAIPPDIRPRFTYAIPDSERMYEADPRSVVMVPIRVSDRIDVGRLVEAQGSGVEGQMLESIRRTVVEIDGKIVDWSVTGAEWLERTSPRVLGLIMKAYNRINFPSEDGSKAFLASEVAGAASASGR